MKKLLIGIIILIVLVVAGMAVAARMLLDPERIRATIASEATSALGTPVTVGGAAVSIWPRAGLTLTDISVGEPAALSLRTVEVTTAIGALLSRRIEDAEVIVADSRADLPALMQALNRLSEGAPDAPPAGTEGSAGDEPPLTLVNIRTIAFRNVELTSGGRTFTVTFESSLAGDRLDIGNFELKSPVTTLTATGVVESLSARRAKLQVTADPLDLDGMMAVFTEAGASGAAGASRASGATGPLDLTIDLTAVKGRAGGVGFTVLTTTAHVTERGVDLQPFSLGVFGGRLDGAVKVDASGSEPALSVQGKVTGIDMAAVAEYSGEEGAITGRLGGTMSLSGKGTDPSAALATATGEGTVAITDGTMPGLHLVREIVLAFGRPAPQQSASSGEAFSRLGATFRLGGGTVRFTDLSFDSPDVALKGSGTLALADSALDVTGRAMLSKDLTAQAGRDLVRYTAEDGRVTVPATVSGTVSAPRVRVNVGDLAKRALTNEATSQLKKQTDSLLKGLLKKKP